MKSLKISFACALISIFAAGNASAFSVKVHIYYANLIHAELVRNFQATGENKITLISPDGRKGKTVYLNADDAKAIRENPEYFRGGAIGPDNTAFPGLTDPSHGAGMFPFQQCEGLKAAAKDPQERAYALGCFLHGITDNVAHHIVNYFTQQTFTLTPAYRLARTPSEDEVLRSTEGKVIPECNIAHRDATGLKIEKVKGEYSCVEIDRNSSHEYVVPEDFTNVVKHILVERTFEAAVVAGLSTENAVYFTEPYLRHKIARRLFREAYLNPQSGDYNMRTLMGPLIESKRDFVKKYLANNPAETGDIKIDGETESRAEADLIALDSRRLEALGEFVKTKGIVVDGNRISTSNTGLTPYQYVLLLPELIGDVKQDLAEFHKNVVEASKSRCSGLSLKPTCRVVKWLMTEDRAFPKGRLQFLVDSRTEQLDKILDAHIESIERLSNTLVLGEGVPNPRVIFAPVDEAINQLTALPDNFFPAWMTLFGIPKYFKAIATEVKQKIVTYITDIIKSYTEQLRKEILLLVEPLKEAYKEEIAALEAKIKKATDAARRALNTRVNEGVDLKGKEFGVLEHFPKTVAHMNAFNSIAGVLATAEVVAPKAGTKFFSGPVSFDASYQLEYNQLAVCENLRKDFYPCGISVAEMLQPGGFANCTELQPSADGSGQPNIECYNGNKLVPSSNPTADDCQRTDMETFLSGETGYKGSFTMSFPARLAPEAPVCHNIELKLGQ